MSDTRGEITENVTSQLDAELSNLRQMFAQGPGFMCFLRGRAHVFEIVNAAYTQLVGHRDVVGMPIAEALPELSRQGFSELLDRVFSSGEPFLGHEVKVQLQRSPGLELEERLVDFVFQPIRGADEGVVGIFVQGHDITAQHHADAQKLSMASAGDVARRELEAADAQRRFLIETIPVQVWTSAADGRLDFVSQRVADYFQTPAEEILGNGWQAVIHPEDLADCIARWTRSLATGDPYEIEFRLRRGDGKYRWHLGRANAQLDTRGKILRWFGTNTDIHEAKLAVEELHARSEYEQRLIGIVSHDLRNPLNAISLATSLLASKALGTSDQKVVTRLTRATDRAQRLIADLLDFASARIGTTIPINPRPTNLREIVEQVVDEFQSGSSSRVVRIGHVGVETGSWDADRIAQVVSNLVGNALQHGAAETPIVVESRIEGDDAILAVKNEGPPIPPAELLELFKPFKRGEHARAAGGSAGLGLYIAREVVVAHGGSIEVESIEGAGTCFTVRMPRFTASPGL